LPKKLEDIRKKVGYKPQAQANAKANPQPKPNPKQQQPIQDGNKKNKKNTSNKQRNRKLKKHGKRFLPSQESPTQRSKSMEKHGIGVNFTCSGPFILQVSVERIQRIKRNFKQAMQISLRSKPTMVLQALSRRWPPLSFLLVAPPREFDRDGSLPLPRHLI
jgi:hypothetical protein